jgi:N-methylhydantoinase A
MTARRWRVGVDIGGTFTDVTALDPTSHATVTAKVRTRVGDPLASLRAALAALGLGWEDVASLVHGTTLVTNAIVEDRLPAVALVATAGFADVLAIARQNRRSLYSLSLPPKLPPLVPEPLRFELKERMGPDGKVKTPLEPADLEPLVEAIRRSGASSVAVSLLHAYANPAHERMVGDRLAAAVPHVSLSHQVNPEEREYERTSATVLNAAVMPLIGSYLDELGREVPKATQFHLFHSAGGMASTGMVRERPLVLALSGPAAGVSAAWRSITCSPSTWAAPPPTSASSGTESQSAAAKRTLPTGRFARPWSRCSRSALAAARSPMSRRACCGSGRKAPELAPARSVTAWAARSRP